MLTINPRNPGCIKYDSEFIERMTLHHGEICGVNIKPIFDDIVVYKKLKKFKSDYSSEFNFMDTKLEREIDCVKYGLFIHIRMEDGSQIDAAWSLGNIYSMNNSLNVFTKKKSPNRGLTLFNVFRHFNVREWVELIGVKLNVYIGPDDGLGVGRTIYVQHVERATDSEGYENLYMEPEFYEWHKAE